MFGVLLNSNSRVASGTFGQYLWVKFWSKNVRCGPLPNICTKDMVECLVWFPVECSAIEFDLGF